MSNNGYVSISTHGPDVAKVPRRVHKKFITVSVLRLVTPDQRKFLEKYAPTGIMKLMMQKNNCDGCSMRKLRIGNSGTKIVIIEVKGS